ncbi:MAG: hypothetical protein R2731_01880 [Nocardioides sp.]
MPDVPPVPAVYVVTDIELDGPWPGANSMRSFASVAVRGDGRLLATFEAVLEPLAGSAPSPETLAWFETQGEAWAAATTDPRPVPQVLADWVAWIRALGAPAVFVSAPMALDGVWIDYYLRRFTAYGLLQGPYEADRLFARHLCLNSYAAGVVGGHPATFTVHDLPAEWFGDVPHSHRALDDALGYAHLLATLLARRPQPG